MLVYKLVDSTNLRARKSSTSVQSDRVKPELCQVVLTLYMDMRWFIAIPCVEEETIWPDPQSCWHYSTFILPVLAQRGCGSAAGGRPSAEPSYRTADCRIASRPRTPSQSPQASSRPRCGPCISPSHEPHSAVPAYCAGNTKWPQESRADLTPFCLF